MCIFPQICRWWIWPFDPWQNRTVHGNEGYKWHQPPPLSPVLLSEIRAIYLSANSWDTQKPFLLSSSVYKEKWGGKKLVLSKWQKASYWTSNEVPMELKPRCFRLPFRHVRQIAAHLRPVYIRSASKVARGMFRPLWKSAIRCKDGNKFRWHTRSPQKGEAGAHFPSTRAQNIFACTTGYILNANDRKPPRQTWGCVMLSLVGGRLYCEKPNVVIDF